MSFFGSIKKAIKDVGKGVKHVAKQYDKHVLQKVKKSILKKAPAILGGVGTALGGPAGGAIGAKLGVALTKKQKKALKKLKPTPESPVPVASTNGLAMPNPQTVVLFAALAVAGVLILRKD